MNETRLALATVIDGAGKVLLSGTEARCLGWLALNGESGATMCLLYPGAIIAGLRVIEFGWTERGGVFWRGEKVEK